MPSIIFRAMPMSSFDSFFTRAHACFADYAVFEALLLVPPWLYADGVVYAYATYESYAVSMLSSLR